MTSLTSFEAIRDQAITEAWSNKKAKNALHAAGLDDRMGELIAKMREKLSRPVGPAVAAPVEVAPAPAPAPAAPVAPVAQGPTREEQLAAAKAAIRDGAVIWCDAAANQVTRVINGYGRKAVYDNGGCRIGLRVDTPAGRYEETHINTQCVSAKNGERDSFAGECFAVLKAVDLAVQCGLSACTISNDRIGSFQSTTKRGYVGAKYLWVAAKLAAENKIAVTFAPCSGADNKADSTSRKEVL